MNIPLQLAGSCLKHIVLPYTPDIAEQNPNDLILFELIYLSNTCKAFGDELDLPKAALRQKKLNRIHRQI